MIMITEDFCSFEVAKLLKEKGFDGDTSSCYILEDGTHHIMSDKVVQNEYYESQDSNEHGHLIQAPTHQMAMKWLRKVLIQHIQISYLHGAYREYEYVVINTFNGKAYCEPVSFSSYEEAVEAALKYTLENLI